MKTDLKQRYFRLASTDSSKEDMVARMNLSCPPSVTFLLNALPSFLIWLASFVGSLSPSLPPSFSVSPSMKTPLIPGPHQSGKMRLSVSLSPLPALEA